MSDATIYSIGQVAELFNLNISTLRYYDQLGLFPDLQRDANGRRQFGPDELNTLTIVECLKRTGMPLDDIQRFMAWCDAGDETIDQRLAMFLDRRQAVQQQIQELEQTLTVIDHKCEYYQQAHQDGTEAYVKKQTDDVYHLVH
ncbi:MerR family transcriptional regulator [Limosilactobacillus equigenerosi]|uniref:MerR family transcriptional regulator n=1 Tax=Limosilactobacillus equigenerosi DSM 18793 = JCM 14505 TaxID=1423742 RepID=A0A0R1UT62_9LACO|nr:MerR family transcriptional regulator [Limosilactobacillus equigenerosi]KRL96381.1 MerR family transcriptional regulator [Limosilactobacillus equigenerosi DSM 18793 = JCM 14505]